MTDSPPSPAPVRLERLDLRIDEHREGNGFGIRIAFVGAKTEDHDAQVDADLRRGQARAVERLPWYRSCRRRAHAGPACRNARPAARPHQLRIAGAQNLPDHCLQSWPSTSLTRTIDSCSDASIRSKLIAFTAALARGMVGDHVDRRIGDVQLTRERGFGHRGHPYHIAAIAFDARDPRPRSRASDPAWSHTRHHRRHPHPHPRQRSADAREPSHRRVR